MSNISLNGAFLVFVFIASLRLGLVFVRKGWEKNGYLSIAIGVLIWFLVVWGFVSMGELPDSVGSLGFSTIFRFFPIVFFWGGRVLICFFMFG